jgi:hypothetical protein
MVMSAFAQRPAQTDLKERSQRSFEDGGKYFIKKNYS